MWATNYANIKWIFIFNEVRIKKKYIKENLTRISSQTILNYTSKKCEATKWFTCTNACLTFYLTYINAYDSGRFGLINTCWLLLLFIFHLYLRCWICHYILRMPSKLLTHPKSIYSFRVECCYRTQFYNEQ